MASNEKAKLRPPKPPEMHPTVGVDYRFESFRLIPGAKTYGPDSVELNRSVTSAELELTIDGGSTLTVTVEDPHDALLRSTTLTRWAWGENSLDEKEWLVKGRAIDVELDDLFFRLVRISKQGTSLTLVLRTGRWCG